jgi:hypothetical protein
MNTKTKLTLSAILISLSSVSFSQSYSGGSGACASHNVKKINNEKVKVTLKNSCGKIVYVQYCYYMSGSHNMNSLSANGGQTNSTNFYPDKGTNFTTRQGYSYEEAACR